MEPSQNTHGRSRRSGTEGPEGLWMHGVTDEQLECSGIATEHSSLGSWCDQTCIKFPFWNGFWLSREPPLALRKAADPQELPWSSLPGAKPWTG